MSDQVTLTAPTPPRIPTGREVFDAIMGHIEPELTTQGLVMLQEKYKTETPEQAAERKKRYAIAFERYEQAYQGYLATLDAQVMRFRHESFAGVELESKSKDQSALDTLATQFSQAA